ncbi:efflux RND transporter periplasmic adaptor subunit [Aromatoleum sp.]|uniref:efflux RND transporter periplasmic adaptor subunit n=1 Tax=Aromatoleum sp. TaxID=2307007 RepID=UPI002FCAE948
MKPRFSRIPVALAIVASASFFLAACGSDAEKGGPAAPPPPKVSVLTLASRPVTLSTELAGRTAPYVVAEVRPQVRGIVKERLFEEGARVKAGQTLYRIDSATYEADLESAKAGLAKAEANVATVRLKAQRFDELVGINAVSRQARDDATAALKQAEADIATAKASVKAAQINVDYTRVSAPISGQAGRSSVTPGALVTANQQAAMVTVQQLDPIYVDIQRASTELLALRRDFAAGRLKRAEGDKARVKLTLEDRTEYPLEGTLQFAETTVDPGTGNVTLRAVFPNPNHMLLPGMYVNAVLEEGVSEHAILAPQAAVMRDPKGNATALVLGDDGKVQQRQLKVERAVGDQWLVTDGLAAGDRLILDGLQKLRPGMTAEVAEPAAKVATVPPAPADASARQPATSK